MLTTDQPTLSLAEAAQALGCAAKTVRQRIKRGEIQAHLVDGPHGPEYRIPVSALPEITLPFPAGYPTGHTTLPPDPSQDAAPGPPVPGQATLPPDPDAAHEVSKRPAAGDVSTSENQRFDVSVDGHRPQEIAEEFRGNRPAITADLEAQLRVLQERLHGAHQAAKIHAERRADAELASREERERQERDRERERAAAAAEIAFLRERLVHAEDTGRALQVMLSQVTQALNAATQRPALEARNITPRRSWWRWWRRR